MSSIRHELPSGGWVEVRDHTLMRSKDKKTFLRKFAPRAEDLSDLEKGFLLTDGLMAALITDWKLPYEPDPADDGSPREWVLPSADETLVDELTAPDYEAVQKIIEDARKVLFPVPASPDQVNDKLSPSGPANA